MLKILISIALCILIGAPLHAAPGPQDNRRIEEQKRELLKSTDYRHKEKTQKAPEPGTKSSSPLQPDDVVYLVEMSLRKVTYGYDLCKTLIILKGLENKYIDLNSQVNYLKENNLLPKKLKNNFDPMKPLRRGTVAYVLSQALDVKGGIFLRLFRNSERYALKELAYEGIMSSGNVNEIISGDELSASITRAIEHTKR